MTARQSAGLRKLRIVAFDLKEGEDNPHRIFETMNACGRDLSCADMIGNYTLMPVDRERQERLYTDHQRSIERGFERHGGEHFDAFIRHYLTLGTGEAPGHPANHGLRQDPCASTGTARRQTQPQIPRGLRRMVTTMLTRPRSQHFSGVPSSLQNSGTDLVPERVLRIPSQ